MKLSHFVAGLMLAAALAPFPASAETADWLVRCRFELATSPKPETGMYFFQTLGKDGGAKARGTFDYNSDFSARAVTYPGAAKDLLNPYGNVSVSLGYVTPADGKGPTSNGHISVSLIGKDFNPIPGSPITIRIGASGASFGPYQTKPVSSGMYGLWFDTADTDGDSKPPVLSPPEFAKLARAIEGASAVDVTLVQHGADIVRASVPLTQRNAWRDGLAAWTGKTAPGVGAATICPAGGETVN